MKRISIGLLTALLIAASAQTATAQAAPATAQTAGGPAVGTEDEDALFGGPTGASEATGTTDAKAPGGQSAAVVSGVDEKTSDQSTLLLSSDKAELGGKFRFKASSSWNYDGLAGPAEGASDSDDLELDLGADIFLDARPSEDFRVFAKTAVSYPFTDQGGERKFDDVFHVKELFSDFHLGDAVFFRAGKQTINWGVGYFFSPADLLNVTEIDPEDPTAELEGPVALKVQIPLGIHNLYLYTIFQDAEKTEEIGLAPKAEFVVGDTELGFGAYYRKHDAPAFMTTATTNWGDYRLFGEGVLSVGSNRTFVAEDAKAPLGIRTETEDDDLFPSFTLGTIYSFVDDDENFNLSVSLQYLYNGEGYDDAGLLRRNAAAVRSLSTSGQLSAADLRNSGRHYGAVNVSWTSMFTSDFSSGCLWIANLADGSGTVAPSLSWKPIDELVFTVKPSWRYGQTGAEYTPQGDGMSITLTASFGGGAF